MTVIKFPTPPKEIELGEVCGGVWTCGCGCQHWALYENGVVLCPQCNCISTVLRVEEVPAPPEGKK
jgi:hypothetical protein